MSFALLADSTSEDPRELLKKANAKETTKPEVVAEAPSQNQNKPKSAGKKDDKVSRGPRKPRSDDGAQGDAIEGDRPHRGGRGGRGGRGRHHGYVPPKRGFEHDRSVSRTGRGKEIQKGGHGKFNYGKEGEEANVEQQPQTETPKEEGAAAPAAEDKPKIEEEVDNTISFADFAKQKAEKKKNIESLVQKAKPREGENIKYDNAIAKYVEKPVEKKEAAPAPVAEKKAEKSTGPVTVNINEFLKDAPVKQRRDNREFRGGRGGRGRGGRGGRGGSRPRSAPAPEFNAKDFPTLK